eukprot:4739707-Alexandrium_andersonii.AAC.1
MLRRNAAEDSSAQSRKVDSCVLRGIGARRAPTLENCASVHPRVSRQLPLVAATEAELLEGLR